MSSRVARRGAKDAKPNREVSTEPTGTCPRESKGLVGVEEKEVTGDVKKVGYWLGHYLILRNSRSLGQADSPAARPEGQPVSRGTVASLGWIGSINNE